MKQPKYIVSLAAMIMGATASAGVIASESFSTGNGADYTSMTTFNITGNSSVLTRTAGFTNTPGKMWYPGTTLIQPSSVAGLTHALVQGSTAKGVLNIRTPSTAIGRNSARSLADTPSGSSFYMSGLVKANNLTTSLDVGDNAAMGLIRAIPLNTWNISSGMGLGLTRDSLGDVYLAAFAAGNVYKLGSKLTAAQAAETQLIVLKLDVDTSGNNDTLTAWVAQQGGANLTQVFSVSDMDTGTAENLKTFVVQGQGANATIAGTGVYLDEFRFGTGLLDVTSISERTR